MKLISSIRKFFSPDVIKALIVDVILIGIFVGYMQGCFQRKYAPLTAAETLKKENFLNSKRDTYFETIVLLNRVLANSEFIENGKKSDTINRVRGDKYPTEVEINSCFSKLCIYSDNKEIPLAFYRILNTEDKSVKPIFEMQKIVNLIRKDIGDKKPIIDTTEDRYRFIQVHRLDAASYNN